MGDLGDRMKQIRKAHKLSQEQFAEMLGINHAHVSKIEKGKGSPSELLLRQIESTLLVSKEWLLNGEGEMMINPETILRKVIAIVGDRVFYDAMKNILDEHSAVALAILAPRSGSQEGDPDLDQMINFLLDLWAVGDEKMKTWAAVQFDRAFPPDIKDEVQKKRAENQGQGQVSAG